MSGYGNNLVKIVCTAFDYFTWGLCSMERTKVQVMKKGHKPKAINEYRQFI